MDHYDSNTLYNILKNTTLFSAISETHLKELDKTLFEKRVFKGGEILFNEGEHSDAIYIVVKGRLKVFHQSSATEEVELDTITKGRSIGELSFVLNSDRKASVSAYEESETIYISNKNFIKLLSLPNVGRSILKSIASMVIKTDEKIKEEALKSKAITQLYNKLLSKYKQLKEQPTTVGNSSEGVKAMANTASNQLRQPLGMAKSNVDLINKFITTIDDKEMAKNLKSRMDMINRSLDRMDRILLSYREIKDYDIVDYSEGVKVVQFKIDDR